MICGWQLRWSASFILRRVTVLQTIPQNKPESWPVWSAEECKIFLTIRWCVLLQSLLLWVKVRVRMHGNVCVTHWRMRHVSGWGYLLHTHFIFKFKHSINALHIFWLSGNLHSWKKNDFATSRLHLLTVCEVLMLLEEFIYLFLCFVQSGICAKYTWRSFNELVNGQLQHVMKMHVA